MSRIENPKHEIRNPKQIPMTKIQIIKTRFRHLNIRISNLFRISTFGFRILPQKGVSLLFVVLIMSVILSVGAGISVILIQQTKMIGEIGHSVVSFYAADSGVEQQLYDLYKIPPEKTHMPQYSSVLNNTASYNVTAKCSNTAECYVGFTIDENCTALNYCIKSVGSYEKTKRAIEIEY